MNYEIITAPLIGAAIGTITNGIAIKMLFRPFNPVYIGKFKLPFTPGLIPKEKPRIAKAIAKVVGTNLLDNETIKKTLLSDEIKNKLMSSIEKKVSELSESEQTLNEFLEVKNLLEPVDEKESTLKVTLAENIAKKLVSSGVAATLIDFASEELTKNANPMIAGIASKAISSARDTIINKINELITEKSPSIISDLIDGEYKKLKNKTLSEYTNLLTSKFPDYPEKIWNIYTKFIETQLSRILNGVNMTSIVEQKINEFELPELERLIMEIASKELHALIALGGLLGLLMGFFNLLF